MVRTRGTGIEKGSNLIQIETFGGRKRIRTAVEGFADLCLATRPFDPIFSLGGQRYDNL